MHNFFRHLIGFVILVILPVSLYSKNILSKSATVSILTCSEGDELYSAFGHSAIRVFDKERNVDLVFNYGTFDFNTPNFYLKFANGKLNYLLSYNKFKRFLPEYFSDNRGVIEQELNLSYKEKQQIFNALIENYKPENRFYKYDFFYDNCATRIFDIIKDNIDGEVIIKRDTINCDRTFRNYLHHYLSESPWIEMGLKILLGLPADKIATPKESTFLPDFLMEVLNNSEISSTDNSRDLIAKTNILLEKDLTKTGDNFRITPIFCAWMLLILVLLGSFLINKAHFAWNIFDRILFGVCGLIGLLILYLWLATDHQVTRYNMNILWSFPSFIIIALFNWKSNKNKKLLWVNLVLVTIFIIGWYWIPQDFPQASLPFSIIILYRIISRIKPVFMELQTP
ncbi:DUF4105 domain-containing protein [Plebeiibacterium marinum]|uniref:DUF4105 domain-containing protein n=1 Tax=Plebeiibacterium marinum TaxID=2992111 RepID=A0AAE3SJI4_9BACT|nr:DUF4105 domain-containing protein [Plebeiobacterium marinum]MCW3805762.1 DUF4105 domain-containing protein [Plebeiobacterium marinum]